MAALSNYETNYIHILSLLSSILAVQIYTYPSHQIEMKAAYYV